MNRERLISFVWAALLSFCLALGGLGMMVSGLELRVQLLPLALLCLVAAFGLCGLLSLKKGGWMAAAGVVAVWLIPGLRLQLKAIVRTILKYMSMAYGTSIPGWLDGKRPETFLPVLLVLGCMMMLPWIGSILKRKTMVPAVAVSLVPLICCVTVTDTVPDFIWVFLWMLPMVLVMLTQGVLRKDTVQGNRLTAILTVPAILMVALVFWLIPEEQANGWDPVGVFDGIVQYIPFVEQTDAGWRLNFSGTASGDRVDLSKMGPRNETRQRVMDVTAGYRGMLYLRERDYDYYSGLSWISDRERSEKLEVLDNVFVTPDGRVEVDTRYPMDRYYLPCYADQTVTLSGGVMDNPSQEQSYSFYVRSLRAGWYKGIEAQPEPVDEAYLQLPEQTALDARNYLAAAGFPEGGTVAEQAEFIRSLVESRGSYDVNTDRMPSEQDDFAMWFLEDGDTGYCVHYATAAAVLLRSAGIPARYVEGYLVEVEPGQTVTVRQQQGHAWVEFYGDGVGWLILEATPGNDDEIDLPTPTEPQTTEPQTTEPQPTESKPTEPKPTESKPTEPQPTESKPKPTESKSTDPTAPQPTEPTPPVSQPTSIGPWLIPLLIVLVLAGTVAALVIRHKLLWRKKQERMHMGSINARGLACYRELCRLAAYQNVPLPKQLEKLAEKAKFSNHTLTEGELQALTAQLLQMQEDLLELPLRKRLVVKYIRILM